MKIICVGRNYADHAKELGNDIPDEPVIFMKPKSALLQSHTPFYYPEFSNELHYECELVLRVCKNGKYIQERHASNYYNGITVGIDFTARDIQDELKKKGLPWEKAKAFDNSAAVGKFIDLTPASNRKNINFTFYKNKELVQTGNSANMIFSIDSIIAHISNYFSLNIGDLIFTGTPAGVGECVVGDLLEAFLEKENLLTVEVK
ncbi:fumarylacetoacetate hydrolase family protein [Ferruginibacter sp.]|jgi:2-keto-4-pentenoate hydratase/2-oxohepta-3-ene-1,7-dioic acid hydratase in catechol pathway|nr:fumarylacetoacetate hydrolase family protein [Ferruginibacter sp.]